MPPRNLEKYNFVTEDDDKDELEAVAIERKNQKKLQKSIVWRNVIWMIYLHGAALYGVYLMFFLKWQSFLWCK